jgi:hypothetical protein
MLCSKLKSDVFTFVFILGIKITFHSFFDRRANK